MCDGTLKKCNWIFIPQIFFIFVATLMHRFQSVCPYSLPLTAHLPPTVLSVLHPVFVSCAVYLWEVDPLHQV